MPVRFYLSQYPAENVVIRALYDGCPEPKTLCTFNEYEPSDVAVVMGVYKKHVPASFARGRIIREQKRRRLDVLVLETGYINRGDGPDNHYALGWNGLNGRADFRNRNSPSDRAAKLGVQLEPWRYGKHVLLCGQVPWDASCDFMDMRGWLDDAVNNICAVTGRQIVFRPHPKAMLPNITGCKYSVGRPLQDDLADAHCVVSFSSNSLVEALIQGIPVFAFDEGAMVYEVANKDWLAIDNPQRTDRAQWLNDLTYCQWTPEEMQSGEAWRHIANRGSQAIPEAQFLGAGRSGGVALPATDAP